MNTISKSILVVCGLSAAVSLPLGAQADTTVFSSQGAYVETIAQNGSLYFYLTVRENASKSKSLKDSSSELYANLVYGESSGFLLLVSSLFNAIDELPAGNHLG